MSERTQSTNESDRASFPRPPVRFTDEADRTIEIRKADEDDLAALVSLYDAIGPADRAQGLPPVTTEQTRSWLDEILSEGFHLVAWHGDQAVGHACLLPTAELGYELLVFVRSSYQGARIGTYLLRALLGEGAAAGVERVWLVVQRKNLAAKNLYEATGFERVDTSPSTRSEIKMARTLCSDG